jgi:valyl-tRNA synthetase
MPFLTEELWRQMGYGTEEESIMLAPWPAAISAEQTALWGIAEATTAFVEAKHTLIGAGRALRADYNIAPTKTVAFIVQARDAETAAKLTGDLASLKALLKAEAMDIRVGGAELAMPSALVALGAIYLPLEGLVDIAAEGKRIRDELGKSRGFLKGIEAKLGNAEFVAKAPAAVVEQQRAKQVELTETIARLERLTKTLSAGAS